MEELEKLEEQKDYATLIREVRDRAADDRRLFADPYIKAWCGRRWRNIFINEAAADASAVKTATKRLKLGRDKRPDTQKIAERFLKGDAIREWDLEMPAAETPDLKNTTFVFCPGLINGILPVRAFTAEFARISEEYGWNIIRADLHPMRGCEANMADLDKAINEGIGLAPDTSRIEAGDAKPPGDFFLMGYSKGVADLLTYLAHHPELKGRVRAVMAWAGAVGGSYTANDIYENVKDMQIESITERIDAVLHMIAPELRVEGTLRRLEEYDVKGAMLDLTTHQREAFMKEHGPTIDGMDVPIFNFTGATSVLEVPYFQMRDYLGLSKYDANNDMQVTQDQAKIKLPLATDAAMLRGHHWDLSYGPFPVMQRMGSPNLDHPFPRHAAIVAHFKFLAELGLID